MAKLRGSAAGGQVARCGLEARRGQEAGRRNRRPGGAVARRQMALRAVRGGRATAEARGRTKAARRLAVRWRCLAAMRRRRGAWPCGGGGARPAMPSCRCGLACAPTAAVTRRGAGRRRCSARDEARSTARRAAPWLSCSDGHRFFFSCFFLIFFFLFPFFLP